MTELNALQNEFLENFFSDNPMLLFQKENLLDALELLRRCYDNGGKVLTCGNGGSAADSEHIVGELMKGFLKRRVLGDMDVKAFQAIPGLPEGFEKKLQKGLPAISLVSQSAILSAFANDVDADMIFAQQVFAYGQPNDVLFALSTSGNSKNVVNAVYAAKAAGVRVIAVTGEKESRLSALCDVTFRVPSRETYRVQEYTLPIYHALCALIEMNYFAE